ncbi:MAG TPA: alpha/beta hydrolase domain-containing protein [Kofleriaceae bacterium]
MTMPSFSRGTFVRSGLVAAALIAAGTGPADARITRIEITRTESPAFGGASFGAVGTYDKLVGRAFGEIDPRDPHNAVIQDLELAPRNARGMVEYAIDIYLLAPHDPARGNATIFYDAVNRGNKVALALFNAGTAGGNEPTSAGDGFLQRQGYTLVWSGWQPDVAAGGGRLTMTVSVARAPGGGEITGRVRGEYIVTARTTTQNLSSGSFTGLTHTSFATVSLDPRDAVLTRRVKEADARVAIPATDWAFADCTAVPFPGTPSATQICLKDGFDPDHIYELVYTAKDPLVSGLGFAATRDLIAFLRHAQKDDAGTANPLAGAIRTALAHGTSQAGRYLRTLLLLGFNRDERGRAVFDGMNPHLAAQQLPLNVRFGQPGRAYGQHEDHLYPTAQPPFAWGPTVDPIAGDTGGILDACRRTRTCPKVIQTVSSTEYWQSRMSLDTTDVHGRHDLPEPPGVRQFHFAGTQHVPAAVPAAGICQQLSNPNPYQQGLRALLVALRDWAVAGTEPPASRIPTLRDHTLVDSAQAAIGWPDIPGVRYSGLLDELRLVEFGRRFDVDRETGVVDEPPRVVARNYTVLVPRVDADGNEVAGLRSVGLQAPLGTYAGWNLRAAGFAEDEVCGLTGSFVPFARTRAEREAAGDPRASLEERYGSHAGYVAAVRAAAARLVAAHLLLPGDGDLLVAQADASSVLR